MNKIPAGLTSTVKANGKKFILQTEFISLSDDNQVSEQFPKAAGKIVTSVSIEGQVVHKVDKAYNESFDNEERFHKAEKAVKKQHISIAKVVSLKAKEFLSAAMSIDVTPEDKLRLICGILNVTKIDFTGSSNNTNSISSENQVLKNVELLRNLVIGISQSTRLGKLKKSVGTIDNEKFILTGFAGETYFLNLKSDADISKVIKELENVRI
ncbi:MAG: hypothetical protein J7K40_11290 [candidate division Zixibacteria bacterium]|nr:hypothetical protein [candidate division Zixibacteria bacterium]